MLPILFNIGPLPIHAYGLMIAIGFLAALYFIQRECRKADIDPDVIGNAAMYSLILGIAGTRVLHIIMFPEYYSWSRPLGWFAIWEGGLVFQGGPPPVLLFLYFYFKKHKISFWKVIDIAAPYLALGHGIGRIGCFLNGCCYGKRTDAALGVAFRRIPGDPSVEPNGSPPYLDQLREGLIDSHAHWSLPVHPTQLYESAGLILLCFLMLAIRKAWRPFDGFMLAVYFVTYGLLRFTIEFFRGDDNPTRIAGLSDQQVFSLSFALLGVAFFAYMLWRKRRSPAA